MGSIRVTHQFIRLIRETDQGGAQVNLTRDGKDDVTAYSDPRSLVTSYVRNGFSEVIRQNSPDSGITDTVRDARGLSVQITDGRGVVTAMTYDNAGRMLTRTYPAAPAENLTYLDSGTQYLILTVRRGFGDTIPIAQRVCVTATTGQAIGSCPQNLDSGTQ